MDTVNGKPQRPVEGYTVPDDFKRFYEAMDACLHPDLPLIVRQTIIGYALDRAQGTLRVQIIGRERVSEETADLAARRLHHFENLMLPKAERADIPFPRVEQRKRKRKKAQLEPLFGVPSNPTVDSFRKYNTEE